MPLSVADTLFDREASTLKEKLGSAAINLMPALDPVFRDMILGHMKAGVELGQQYGRDMLMKKRFFTGLAGVIQGGNINNFQGLYGGATKLVGSVLQQHQLGSAWPDPFQGAVPKAFGLTTTLYGVETNLALSLTMLRLEALEANIKQQVTPVLKGFARNIALWAANSWHADSARQYRLASLGPAAGTGAYVLDAALKTITFNPVEKCTHRFAVGQSVDLWKDSATRVNEAGGVRIPLFVIAVSAWTNTVVLGIEATTSFAGFTTVTIASAGFVTYANIKDATWGFKGLYTWRDWAVWGGANAADKRILRANAITTTADDYIDMTVHPEFESGHFPAFGVLTERKLLEVLETAHSAFIPYGHYADTIMASRGIFQSAFNQYQSLEEINRTGQPGSLRSLGLQQGFKIQAGDRSYEGYTSQYMETGTMLIFRRMNNWALISPPKPAGLQRGGAGVSDDELSGMLPLDFVMPALGHNSPLFPIQKTNLTTGQVGITEHMQLPGEIRMQYQPIEQIPMVVLEGVTESRTYSSVS